MLFEKNKIYVLAGATGTEIQRRGFKTTLPLWSAKIFFEKPEVLTEIYKDYINAGADIITTNTFRTQKRTLKKAGKELEWEKINRLAVQLAKDAVNSSGKPILVAGCIAPLEDCYRPDLMPTESEMKEEHSEQINLLADAGVDFLLLETFNSILEAKIAAEAASKTNKPFVVSFTLNDKGDLLNGDSIEKAVEVISDFGPEAFLVNCNPPEILTIGLEKLKKATKLPMGAYGNGDGGADSAEGWKFEGQDKIEKYTNHCKNWLSLGANIIGGCCGTSPEYTKSYSTLKNF